LPARELDRELVPTTHDCAKLPVLGVVELELVPSQPIEPAKHLREQGGLEAQIFSAASSQSRSSP
jgi:hypothetical protein